MQQQNPMKKLKPKNKTYKNLIMKYQKLLEEKPNDPQAKIWEEKIKFYLEQN